MTRDRAVEALAHQLGVRERDLMAIIDLDDARERNAETDGATRDAMPIEVPSVVAVLPPRPAEDNDAIVFLSDGSVLRYSMARGAYSPIAPVPGTLAYHAWRKDPTIPIEVLTAVVWELQRKRRQHALRAFTDADNDHRRWISASLRECPSWQSLSGADRRRIASCVGIERLRMMQKRQPMSADRWAKAIRSYGGPETLAKEFEALMRERAFDMLRSRDRVWELSARATEISHCDEKKVLGECREAMSKGEDPILIVASALEVKPDLVALMVHDRMALLTDDRRAA